MEFAADCIVDVQIGQQHSLRPHWVKDLLDVVSFDFSRDLVYFCVTCSGGPYQARQFLENGRHFNHDRLEVHNHQSCFSVRERDIVNRGVIPDLVQMYVPPMANADTYFLFLHNTVGFATPITAPSMICLHCGTQLLYLLDLGLNSQSRFCCLSCKIQFETEKGVTSKENGDAPGSARKDDKAKRSISLLPSHVVGQPVFGPGPGFTDRDLPDHYRSLDHLRRT